MVKRALVGLPEDFTQREAAYSFPYGVKLRDVKKHLAMGDDRFPNKALNQNLKLEAATGPSAKLREVVVGTD